ncbi:MAG: hypothetical protein R3D03_04535 [Geminicoccaceae bacterium]
MAVDAPELARLLYALPPALLCWGLALPLNFWSDPRGSFRMSLNRILQYAGQAISQTVLGFGPARHPRPRPRFFRRPPLQIGHFIRTLPAEDRALLRTLRWSEARVMAVRYHRFPAFSILSTLFQSGSQLLPAMLVAGIYGPVIAGWFALSQRIMVFPVMMIGDARPMCSSTRSPSSRLATLPHVLQDRLALLHGRPCDHAADHAGGPRMSSLHLRREPWREAGTIVQILVPLFVMRLTARIGVADAECPPNDRTCISSWAMLNFIGLGLSFTIGWAQDLGELYTLALTASAR